MEDAVGCDLLVLEKVPPEMLEQALHFIYTDSCKMLVHGTRPIIPRSEPQQQQLIHRSAGSRAGEPLRSDVLYRSLPAKDSKMQTSPRPKTLSLGKKARVVYW